MLTSLRNSLYHAASHRLMYRASLERGSMDTVAFAAGAATSLSAWQLVPQVAKSLRVRSTAGLSPIWAAIGGVVNLGWFGYRWAEELWLSLLSPAIATVLYLGLLLLVLRTTPARRGILLAFAGVGSSLVAAGWVGGWPLIGTVLGLWGGVQIAPAVWSSYRVKGVPAIAPGLWVIGLSQSLLWGYYGYMAGDAALVLYGLMMGAGSAMILLRFAAGNKPRTRPSPAIDPHAARTRSLLVGQWASALVFRG